MSTFDPDALECLATILEEGGFERAVQHLFVTQSAVFQRLRSLKAQVGTVLILRRCLVKPAPASDLWLKHTEILHLLRADLEHDLKRAAPQLAGPSAEKRAAVYTVVYKSGAHRAGEA